MRDISRHMEQSLLPFFMCALGRGRPGTSRDDGTTKGASFPRFTPAPAVSTAMKLLIGLSKGRKRKTGEVARWLEDVCTSGE